MVNITNFAATVNSCSIRNVTQNVCNELNVGHRLQNEQNMAIIHYNVNRLYSKLDEIRLYLNAHYPVSVYSCSETFLSSNILDHQISIEGYTIIRGDRISKEGGGLIVYMKNDIECICRNDLEHDIAETIWLEIKLKQKKIILAFIYRPPNEHTISYKTWSNYMDDAISSAYAEDKNIIILGDFNIDLLG